MANTFNPDTALIWKLHEKGMTNKAIAEQNGWGIHKVASAVRRGRDRGIIAKPRMMSAVDHRRRFGGIRRGSIKQVMDGMSEDRQKWLVVNAYEQGYDSLSEFILDILLDVYDDAHGELQ